LVDSLAKIGVPAVEPLIAALGDPDNNLRAGATRALGEIRDERSVVPLIAALGDASQEVRARAADALGVIGDARAVEPLAAALRDSDWYVRHDAANSLIEIGTLGVAPLIAALKDPSPYVRIAAAEALGKVRAASASQALLAGLEARDTALVDGAYTFFIEQGVQGSEDELIQALTEYGDQKMANVFLNCGNQKLEQAARAWATSNRYWVGQTYPGNSLRWGSAR
jgi:HEAT repeat protein